MTFDNYSLFINGERTFIFSGEFHPFRLPVPSLWPDVFQKIKALGLNTVSFYLHWGSLEGKRGDFNDPGALAIEPFLQAAQDAGIYLIARPGPYISEWCEEDDGACGRGLTKRQMRRLLVVAFQAGYRGSRHR